MNADYLAVGQNPHWQKCDYHYTPPQTPLRLYFYEILWVLKVLIRYEVIHLHFLTTISADGWELKILKRLNRKIVVHFRGCEIRNKELNLALHPTWNICSSCDYQSPPCKRPANQNKKELARKYSDLTYVTTPDLKDFYPEGKHLPFFTPFNSLLDDTVSNDHWPDREKFVIVHATNQPGIEGSEEIKLIVNKLIKQGHPIEFKFLTQLPYDIVLKEYAKADLTIGKMKMGYYANSQIESLYLGTPAVTWIREDFITEKILNTSLILSDLSKLDKTIIDLMYDTKRLKSLRKKSKSSILRLHNNEEICREIISDYENIKK